MYHQTSRKFSVGNLLRIVKFAILIPVYRLVRQGPVNTAVWAFVRFRLFATGVSTQRYSRITPTLYVGGQIREGGWQRLRAAGVTSIVNMRREHDDRAAGVSVPEENYLHLPTIDDQPVELADLKHGADWMAQQIAQGGVVYVHCAAGSGRGSRAVRCSAGAP